MINVNSFFSDTLTTVDAVIGHFVSIAYKNFVDANAGIITLLFTVYVMLLGYRFLMHTERADLSTISRHLIVMLCVYSMVMSWNLYNIFIYNIFTNEPGNIAQILINSAGHFQGGESIAQALDGIYDTVIRATMELFGQASFSTSGIAFLFYGILVYLIGTVLCIVALLLFIYAKMMMAVTLALGPIFILFILWDATKNIFTAWLRKLITLAFIPIVTSAILVLMLSVIDVTLPSMNQPAGNMQFYGIAPFLGLSLATTLILSQVFRICSSLGGGITLTSLRKGIDIARSSLEASGAASIARKASDWSKKAANKVKTRLFRNESA